MIEETTVEAEQPEETEKQKKKREKKEQKATKKATKKEGKKEGKKGGRLKLIIMVVAVLAVAGGAKTFLLGGEAPAKPEPPEEGEVVDIGTLVVNIGGSRSTYARVGLAMVTTLGSDPEAVGGRVALVKDAAIGVIAESSPEFLASHKGQSKLRGALSKSARKIYPDGEVLRVVLTELVIQ